MQNPAIGNETGKAQARNMGNFIYGAQQRVLMPQLHAGLHIRVIFNFIDSPGFFSYSPIYIPFVVMFLRDTLTERSRPWQRF